MMKKTTALWLALAAFLVLAGCAIFGSVMTATNWDFSKLSTVSYETNEHEITEDYQNISIMTDTADIVFIPSETTKHSVVCYEEKNAKHAVFVKDDTLVIEFTDTRKWHERIGFHIGTPKITIAVPQGEYGAITVSAGTGDIFVENITAGALNLSVTTGRITVTNAECREDAAVQVSTGEAKLTDIRCKNLSSNGDTGEISLKNVIAEEKFVLERTTGDILFEGCDAAEIFAQTDTGHVTGSLLTDKVFIARTDTGRVDVPETITGGKCEIITDTGDIKITADSFLN